MVDDGRALEKFRFHALIADNFDPRDLLPMTAKAERTLGNPKARPSLIGFNKKRLIIKVFLIGSFTFVGERANLRRVYA